MPLVIPDLTGTVRWRFAPITGSGKRNPVRELAKRIFNRKQVEGRDITNAADVAEEDYLGIDGGGPCGDQDDQ